MTTEMGIDEAVTVSPTATAAILHPESSANNTLRRVVFIVVLLPKDFSFFSSQVI